MGHYDQCCGVVCEPVQRGGPWDIVIMTVCCGEWFLSQYREVGGGTLS